jgi:multiple sugar transport system permease protein
VELKFNLTQGLLKQPLAVRSAYHSQRLALIFVSPALLIMVLIIGYPLVDLFYLSFHSDTMLSPMHQFIGVKNYLSINTWISLKVLTYNTVTWTIGTLFGQAILGFGAALILNREFYGSRVIRTLLLTPWVISPVAVAVIWRWIYIPVYGVIDSVIRKPLAWLSNPHLAMLSLIIINIWAGFPLWLLMLSAGLKTLSADLFEAATMDGANWLGKFRYVTIPGISRILGLTALLALIFTVNSFGLTQLLTGGGPGNSTATVPFEIYYLAFVQQNIGAAAALSVCLTLVLVTVVVFYFRLATRVD